MNNYGSYTPQVARPQDGELITLCKILDALASNSGLYIPAYTSITLGAYSGTNPTIIKYWSGQNGTGNLLATLTLGYDGSGNLTSVSRS